MLVLCALCMKSTLQMGTQVLLEEPHPPTPLAAIPIPQEAAVSSLPSFKQSLGQEDIGVYSRYVGNC